MGRGSCIWFDWQRAKSSSQRTSGRYLITPCDQPHSLTRSSYPLQVSVGLWQLALSYFTFSPFFSSFFFHCKTRQYSIERTGGWGGGTLGSHRYTEYTVEGLCDTTDLLRDKKKRVNNCRHYASDELCRKCLCRVGQNVLQFLRSFFVFLQENVAKMKEKKNTVVEKKER